MKESSGYEHEDAAEHGGEVIDWSQVEPWRLSQAERHAADGEFNRMSVPGEPIHAATGAHEEVPEPELPQVIEDIMDEVLTEEPAIENKKKGWWKPKKKLDTGLKGLLASEAYQSPSNGAEHLSQGGPASTEAPATVMETKLAEAVSESTEAAAIAASEGVRRVFAAGGDVREVAEASDAGEVLTIETTDLALKKNKGFSALMRKLFKAEDVSLPDEVRAANEARINERYAKHQAEEAKRPKPESSKAAALGGAEVKPLGSKPESHYVSQLREQLDIQLRTLARTTDNPEEERHLGDKISELQAAIRKEGGEIAASERPGPNPNEIAVARERILEFRTKIQKLEQMYQEDGRKDHKESIEREILSQEEELRKFEQIARGENPVIEKIETEAAAPVVSSELAATAEPEKLMALDDARTAFEQAAGAFDSIDTSRVAGRIFAKGAADASFSAYHAALNAEVARLRSEKKHAEAKKLQEAEAAVMSKHSANRFAVSKVPQPKRAVEAPAAPAAKPESSTPEGKPDALADAITTFTEVARSWQKTKKKDAAQPEREAKVQESLGSYLALLTEKIDNIVKAERDRLAAANITGEGAKEALRSFYNIAIVRGPLKANTAMLKDFGIKKWEEFPALETFLKHLVDLNSSFE